MPESRNLLRSLTFFILLAPLLAQAGYLSFSDTWVRAVPPNSKMTAAYATIHNSSEYTIWMTGAASDGFGEVQLHETIEEGGMARMVHQDFVKLEPGETVEFKRGGKHFMMFTPKSPVKEGDVHRIDIKLGNGDIESFNATVSRNAPKP